MAFVLVVLASGCDDDPDIPQGPDLAPLADIYDHPTGTLDEENVQDVARLAAAQLARVGELGNLDFVVETVNNVDETVEEFADEGGDDDTGGQVPVDGVARFTTICPGWDPEAALDREANGVLNLTLPFRDSTYLPVIFGAFVGCHFRVVDVVGRRTPLRVELTSAINGYIGPGISLDLSNLTSVLFQLKGTAQYGEQEPFDVDLDFRVFTVGRVETRVSSGDGDVIPYVETGVPSVGIRAANGSFCCVFEDRLCIQTEATSCEGVTTGDQVLRW